MAWLPLVVIVGLMVLAAVLASGTLAVMLVFVAALVVLDRAIGFTGWAWPKPSRASPGCPASGAAKT